MLGEDLILSALRSSKTPRYTVTDDLEQTTLDATADFNGGIFYDLDEALTARQDIVVIASPSSRHLPALRAGLASGAAVFVEKPVSHNLDGLNEVLAMAAKPGAIAAVGCQLRFHPALRHLKRILDDGSLGTILHVNVEEGEYLPGFHPYEDYRSSYAARRELGGGVLLTQIHELDYLQWLLGRPSSVFAVGGTVGNLGIEVEDTATALLHVERQGVSIAVQLHLDFLQRPPRRRCRVVGVSGQVEVDLLAPSLLWIDSEGEVLAHEKYPDFLRSQMFLDEIRHFVEAVESGGGVTVDLADGVAALRTALSIRESMETGLLQRLN